MPKLGLSGGRPRTRYENGVLPAYAMTSAKKYYVSLLKKRQEVKKMKCLTIADNSCIFAGMQLEMDFSGLMADSVGHEHGATEDELHTVASKACDLLGDFPFMHLPSDKRTIQDAQIAAEAIRCKFQNLVVLGIGGSALGLKMLAQALLQPHHNLRDSKTRGGFPRLFVCDNIDPDHFGSLIRMLDWKETCINVISKSGATTETMAQFYIVKDILLKKLSAKKWKENIVITTDPTQGPLRAMAKEEGLKNFSIPPNIGGRYSVMSAVGLFPAACVGIDIALLAAGARDAAEQCKSQKTENNPALKNAAVHYLMDTAKGKHISVMMPYSDSLTLFSDWYAQLWAESLGKKGLGQTPVKALGATDQHSQLQLYMEGPNDKIITLIGVEKFAQELPITKNVAKDFDYIGGRSLWGGLKGEERATAQALREAKRPALTITLPEISARTMGELIMTYQIQTALAGKLYGINPFDQPGVELGKKLIRQILR